MKNFTSKTRITPEYDNYYVKPAVSKLEDLLNFIMNQAEETVFNIFEREYKFVLDMTDRKLWSQVLGATISM